MTQHLKMPLEYVYLFAKFINQNFPNPTYHEKETFIFKSMYLWGFLSGLSDCSVKKSMNKYLEYENMKIYKQ